MADLTKTAGTTLLAWQSLTNGGYVASTPADVSGAFGATVVILVGRTSASANTAGWPLCRVEVSAKATGDDTWVPVANFVPTAGASVANTTLNGAVSAAAATVVLTAATNVAAGDLLFLGDSSTDNYEVAEVRSVSSATVTLNDATTFSHSNGAAVTDQADKFVAQVDLTGVTRLRVAVANGGNARTVNVAAYLVTGDAIE
jgi:hypothetical protein